MKKVLLISIAVLGLTVAHGQSQVSFQKFYRNIYEFNSLGSFGATVIQTNDSGYVIIGLNTDTLNAGSDDIYLIKTNRFGDTLWTKIYGTSSYDAAYRIIQTSDGGFAFCGQSGNNPFLIKTNSFGDTLWTKQYSSTSYSGMAHNLQQTSDGGFILAGEGDATGNTDFLLIKTDLVGNLQWAKTFGGSGLERAFSVFQINGTGYILSGFTESFSVMSDEMYVVRTDLNGNLLWSKIYGGSRNDIPYCMQKTNDGGYVLAGESTSFNGGNNQDIYVIKIDSSGNLIWSKDYDYSWYDYSFYISQTNDNGFIVSGGINVGGGNYSPYLLKINPNGDTMWSKTIDTNNIAYCAIQTKDNGFSILTSKTNTSSQGLSLIKTDSLGNACLQNSIHANIIANTTTVSIPSTSSNTANFTTTTMNVKIGSRGNISQICPSLSGIEILYNNNEISIYPNPASNQFFIDANTIDKLTMVLYDVNGRLVLIRSISGKSNIDISSLDEGVYTISIISNEGVINKKLVIIK
ncbi:MAG: T9SS type A sorting domain-containing protein [Bacteroidia bacterium]